MHHSASHRVQAELRQLFAAEGFRCDDIVTHQRTISNRARELTMERQWVQATFTYLGPGQLTTRAHNKCLCKVCCSCRSLAGSAGVDDV